MTEAEQLDLFVGRVSELLATRLVRNGDLRTSFNLEAALDRPLQFSTHTPDEEDLRSFLLTFRQFIAEKEPVFVRSVANLLWRRLQGDQMRANLKAARAAYGQALQRGAVGFIVNEHRFAPEDVLDLWINGQYFHNDERKARTLRALDPVSSVFVRHVFLDALVDVSNYLIFLRAVVLLGRSDGLL